jgi:glutaminase
MNLDRPAAFVSTGELPPPELVRTLVDEAHERFASVDEGEPSRVYPALAEVRRELFGICVVGARGGVHGVGDADVEFTIMSVAKPFVFALVCAEFGAEEVRRRVGANATGLPFNSLTAIEQGDEGRTNPMVNAGAIATTSLVPGATSDERWGFIVDGLSRFAGRPLSLDEEVYRSASQTNYVNRSIANLLESRGALSGDPTAAVDLYTRQSSLAVTARDLATMGATLALGGVNPVIGGRVVDEETCRHVLAVMTTAGLYETSGDWLYDVGLPGKSGIGGGIVTVAPGKGGLATFAPPLDGAGNSVRGQLATRFLSRALGLDIFLSRAPEHSSTTRPAKDPK